METKARDGAIELSVATYNIHGGIGTDDRFDLGRIAAVLDEIGADVMALQEVGDVRGRGPAGNYAAELGERLSCTAIYQPTILRGDRAYGNAILTRLPVDGSRSYDLSVRRREPRGCLRADLRLGSQPLHVFAVHLGLARSEQRAQAGMLLGADIVRDAAVAWPLVVMGDFNFWFPGPIARMVRRALIDSASKAGVRRASYPTRLPYLRLDRIYIDEAWDILDVRVHRTPLAKLASDHYPLVARLRLRAEAIVLPERTERGILA
ncbi:endonuclease/exonuclease/phosphatase family protein [Vulgatibacter incomptus]|uniref:Endonuclease/exonuclease/phosphatase n=1 Tax=Vulgatibacter incomptus TaxID=1391653 RepID=A0A0K1P8E8_9BACT|nr:endonuclease/exonuclease/phosphatase family protein [Vulgatibacter incomptus]AKU89790.1 Endonuclease/exonuclease/phosphatase [Vulgatibacter incomptus]